MEDALRKFIWQMFRLSFAAIIFGSMIVIAQTPDDPRNFGIYEFTN